MVSNAAQGETALQPGNGIGDNASDQITTISTASGIIIGTRVDSTGSRVEMNSGGFFAYDANGETVGITSAGVARFKGSVTGSSFTSTNYGSAAGSGLAITSVSNGDVLLFNVAASQRASLAVVSGGINLVTGSSSLTMAYAGAITINGGSNRINLGSVAYLMDGSGDGTGGGLGILRNIWASSGDPSGGASGDVWLKWA